MRALAHTVISAAAEACGMPMDAIYPELEHEGREKIMLPERRMEIACLEERLEYQGWRAAKVQYPGELWPRTRISLYKSTLSVRVLVRDTDQEALDAFCLALLRALPSKVKAADGGTVRIKAIKAVRKGYTFGSIKIEEKPTQAIHVQITGAIHRDDQTGYINKITLHPYWR